MALFDKRHGRGRRGVQISRGVGKSSGAATRGVSSESEMAAKAPAGARILNNHITNSLYDADTRYPGAGADATSWAGYRAGPFDYNRGENAFYPIRIGSTSGSISNNIFLTVNGFYNNVPHIDQAKQVPSRFNQFLSPNAKNLGLKVKVTFHRDQSDGGGTYTRNFTFEKPFDAVTQYASTSGMGGGDYNNVTFEISPPGASVNLVNFGVDWTNAFGGVGDTSQLGEHQPFGGAYSGSTLKVPVSRKGHPNPRFSVNGTGSFWYKNVMPTGWLHYNSLYMSDDTGVWETMFEKKFLRHRKFDDEFRDIREHIDGSPGTNNEGYAIGPLQRRILEINGGSCRMTETKTSLWSPPAGEKTLLRGFRRSYPDIPMWGLCNHKIAPSGFPASSTNITQYAAWVKHSMQQSVPIPDGAYYCKYGAYVRIPPNDRHSVNCPTKRFFQKNFAAIEVSQDRGAGLQDSPLAGNNEREVWGHQTRFVDTDNGNKGDNFVNMLPLFVTNDSSDCPFMPVYNWNGLASIYNFTDSPRLIAANINNTGPAWPYGYRYPTDIKVTGVTYHNTPFEEFKLVESTWYGHQTSPTASPTGLRLAPNRRPFIEGSTSDTSDELGDYNASTFRKSRVSKLIAQDLMTNSNRHATDRIVLDSPPEFGIFFSSGSGNDAVANERVLIEVDSPNPSVFAPGTYYGKISQASGAFGLGSTTAAIILERAKFKSQAEISTDASNDHSVLAITDNISSNNENDYSVKVFRTKTGGQYMSPAVGVDKYQTYLKQVKYLKYELCFYEHADSIGTNVTKTLRDLDISSPNRSAGDLSGRVQYFNPFVKFFGQNDTPINP